MSSLTVNAKANDAIRSNNGLLIKSGTITAISVDDGILGRDYLVVKGDDVTVNSVGDGLKSDNLQEPEAGYVLITGGTLKITSSQGDAITAQTDLLISGGTLTLTSGGGSNNTPDENVSTKGLKAVVSIILQGGTVNVNSCDDAVHSNLVVIINNGVCNVASGDVAIAAEKSLTVNSGTVGITKSFDGMKSAEVTINSGYINVVSDDDGISATDFLVIKGGQITVNSVGDGLKTENTEYTTKGYITIQAGTITVTSTKGDAVAAQTDLSIATGTFTLTSGGGSSVSPNESISTKGLKGTKTITIDGGTFTVSSSDDAVHSNGVIIINSGTFNLATGDDAIHADTSITVNGGTFTISKCYEGIESSEITINDGYIQIASSDDGINAGEESFGFGMPGPGGSQSTGSNYFLKINGGIIIIDADGDGIDINGYIVMTNGLLVINGPTSNMNGPIDYNQYFQISGGTVVASGSSGMAQAPSTGSQRSVLVRFTNVQQANTLITIQTASGETVLTFRPTKMFQSLAFSSSELVAGSYVVYLGGSSTGVPTYGIYEGGIYTPGTQVRTFNVN